MTIRTLAICACIGALLWPPNLVLAGPNEGGTLILHANPSLTFTSDIPSYCGMAGLDSCSNAVTSVAWESEKTIVFHAIAAFPPGSSPRLKGLSFGISYDPAKFILATRGSCADFELPDGAWPASGTGTAQTWTTATQTGLLTEAYWFAGYAYAEDEEAPDSTTVELIPHPLHGGKFIDDAFPAGEDTVAGYGALGFGRPGALPCPAGPGQVIWIPSGSDTNEGSDEPPLLDLHPMAVWDLSVQQDRASVDLNLFSDPAYGREFPLASIRVTKLIVTLSNSGDAPSPRVRVLACPLAVSHDGALTSPAEHLFEQGAFPASFLSTGVSDRVFLLRQPGAPKQGEAGLSIFRASLGPDVSEQDIVGWDLSPDENLAVVHTKNRAMFYTRANPRPLQELHHAFTDVAFSRNGKLVAGVSRSGASSAIALYDGNAQLIFEEPPAPGDISQLYLSPSGNELIFDQEIDSRLRILGLSTRTRQRTELLNVPDGYRYYSADGLTMLVLQDGFGRAMIYDMSDPFSPSLLGTYQADGLLLTGAVNADGSLVALERNDGAADGVPRRSVIVFNRHLEELATLLRDTSIAGLQFEAEFLLVGVQDHPYPAGIHFNTTTEVRIFDLSH